jgi:hypothetical protein
MRNRPRLRNEMREQLVPSYATGLPAEVSRANQAAAEAIDAYERGTAAWRLADAEAKAAPGLDAEAIAAAHTAGKKPPPLTASSKEAEAKAAAIARDHLKAEAESSLRKLHRTVGAAVTNGEWIEHQHGVVDQSTASIDALAEQIATAFETHADECALLDALYRYLEAASTRGGAPTRDKDLSFTRRRTVGTPAEFKRPNGSTERVGKPIPANPDSLVAALSDIARQFVQERPEELSEEEQRQREEFQETQRAWTQMARGGVHVP